MTSLWPLGNRLTFFPCILTFNRETEKAGEGAEKPRQVVCMECIATNQVNRLSLTFHLFAVKSPLANLCLLKLKLQSFGGPSHS